MDEEAVLEVRNVIASMREHQKYITDDYQRFGYDNFLSGYIACCTKLGIKVD